MCDLPGAKGGKWKFRRLFADGKIQIRARWPNFDPNNPIDGGWARIDAPAVPDSQQAFRYKPGTFPRHWAKPTEGEVNVYYGNFDMEWANEIVPIKRIDEAKRIITLVRPDARFRPPLVVLAHAVPRRHPQPKGEGFPGAASWSKTYWRNSISRASGASIRRKASSTSGRRRGLSRFSRWRKWDCPSQGRVEVVAPVLDRLVALHRTSYVTIRGFTFTETTDGDEPQPGGVEGLGAMFAAEGLKYSGEALHLNRAEHCRIEDNHFFGVGGNAIYLTGYNARNIIRRNEIAHAGANGIGLAGAMGYGDFLNAEGNRVHHNVERRDKKGRRSSSTRA